MIALAFILGILLSRWFETTLSRILLKLPLPEGVRSAVRRNAREQGIDTLEKGKIIKTDAYDAARSLEEGNVLVNLNRNAVSNPD